ncbi:L,D-transpeptidase [uncultured Bifidobacterium sp.]|uniref:L,D-transpeptidase n=1 Tax=uncultured Bifidobacterium sp. TaxID=165187 RepID=UPI00259114F1|nr:L,D-transpeptidase [uncultured Bifidobacterium sp.]MEE0654513.1 L,D-transpeptidase [Bifidobacterium criceti]
MSFSNGNHGVDGDGEGLFAPATQGVGRPAGADVDDLEIARKPQQPKKRRIWPWIVLGAVVLAGAAAAGTYAYFQNRALPGTTLWGHSVAGKDESQIARMIDDQVASVSVPVSYEGTTANVTAADLGIDVDADAIAKQVVDAKRDGSVWTRYMPWDKKDVDPQITPETDASVLDAKLGTNSTKPVDASLKLTDDGAHVETVAGADGSGADAKDVADEAVRTITSLGGSTAKTVELTMDTIKPTIDDATAGEAKETLNKLIDGNAGIAIGDEKVASFGAKALLDSVRIEPNKESTLKDGESRDGVVVFDAAKLQKHYDDDIKPHYSSTKEDREVIVNNNGEEIKVISEGHDGVKIKEGADANVGQQAAEAFANGKSDVQVDGDVDKMQVKKTKRHIIVDMSDKKLYFIENGKQIKAINVLVGQDNNDTTGACEGDFCTPTGDFKIFRKMENETMRGNIKLPDGRVEKWDIPNVGFSNYFTDDGCAIHRIATSAPVSNDELTSMVNRTHGCVSLGWDTAQSLYDFAPLGTTVHIQL